MEELRKKVACFQNNTLVCVIVCLMVAVCGGIYYYGLHLGFAPSGETATSITKYALADMCGKPLPGFEGNLWNLNCYLIYKFFGCTYLSVRLTNIIPHVIFIFFFTFLAITVPNSDKRTSKYALYMLPLAVFLMYILHPMGGASDYGKVSDMVYLFPTDNHEMAVLFASLSYLFVYIIERAKVSKKKISIWTTASLLGITVLYGVAKTDAVYLICFLAPCCVACLVRGIKRLNDWRKLLACLVLSMLALVILKFIGGGLSDFLWCKDDVYIYHGRFYGDSTWLSASKLVYNLQTTMKGLLQLFNVDFTKIPLLGAYSIIIVFRLILVCSGFCFAFSGIRKSLVNPVGSQDFFDEILAWAVVIMPFFFFISTYPDEEHQIRYISSIVWILTVFLCRRLSSNEKIKEFCKTKLNGNITILRSFFAACVMILCIGYANNVFVFQTDDDPYEISEAAIIAYLQENDKNAITVGSMWVADRMMVKANGELFLFDNIAKVEEYLGEETQINYFVGISGDSYNDLDASMRMKEDIEKEYNMRVVLNTSKLTLYDLQKK